MSTIALAPQVTPTRSIYNRDHHAAIKTTPNPPPQTPATLSLTSTPSKGTGPSLDLIMGKQQVKDHDDRAGDEASILHTPRRGRRVGGVDLGWESPVVSAQGPQSASAVTPRKRRSEQSSSPGPHIRLLDSQGRASAAVMRATDQSIKTGPEESSEATQSPQHTTTQASPTKVRKYDRLAGFDGDETTGIDPALIPVEVPMMGRMAVHRCEANQIACIDSLALDRSSASGSGGTSISSTSTKPTSISTPCPTDPSPSFSLASHFPASEPNSPTKGYGHSKHELTSLFNSHPAGRTTHQMIQFLRDSFQKRSKEEAREEDGWSESRYKPRLTGSGMPQLNWPDSPNGPWSSAGTAVRCMQEQKKRGIARWLDEGSDEDEEGGLEPNDGQQHPMVAKAMHDRARKEMLIRSLSMPHLRQARQRISPAKRGGRRKAKQGKERRARGMADGGIAIDANSVFLHAPSALASSAAHLSSLASSSPSSVVGCACGSSDETSSMVQCDACNLWFHLTCIGIANTSDLAEEWFCHGCCDMAANVLSPGSPVGDRASLLATPNFPRSAAIAGQQLRLSQGQLPVFTHPSTNSPSLREEMLLNHQLAAQHNYHGSHPSAFSSILALAPSPPMPSSQDTTRRGNSAGRLRANRIGWHQAEPGSPLERKSGSGASTLHRRNLSGTTSNGTLLFPTLSPSRKRVPTHEQMGQGGDYMPHFPPPRTPSPRLLSTPSRARSSNRSLRDQRRRDSSIKDLDDIFSTPSRILQGSASWGGASHHWQQTPNHANTSMLRHSREDSGMSATGPNGTPWGLSTPTRGFMDSGGFNSDHSGANGGLPSLVFSSGGGGFEMDEYTWQLQSPSSSTRAAARARQNSSNRRVMTSTSSVRERTPSQEQQQQHRHRQNEQSCPSSSPFPKTPTFSDILHHHHHSPPMASPTTARKLNRLSQQQQQQQQQQQLTPTLADTHRSGLQGTVELGSGKRGQGTKSRQASAVAATAATHAARSRNVSSGELMAGLGIGLDLEDVLDWA